VAGPPPDAGANPEQAIPFEFNACANFEVPAYEEAALSLQDPKISTHARQAATRREALIDPRVVLNVAP
jgi:hypothetical protein